MTRGASLLVLAVAVLVTLAAPAAARPRAQAGEVTLRLVSQDLLVAPNGDASFTLDVSGIVPEDAELAVTVNGALAPARAGVDAAVAGEIATPAVGLLTVPFAEVPRDPAGRLSLTVPTVVRRADKTGDNVRLATPGLYPVQIEVRTGGDDVIGRLLTFLARTELPPSDDTIPATPPLAVSVVLPLDARPTLQPDGTTVIGADDRARLQTVADVLGRSSGTPVSLALRPDLVDALGRTGFATDAELQAELGSLVGDVQLLSLPFVAMDPSSATRAELGGEFTDQLRRGDDTLATLLSPLRTDRSTWLADGGIDPAALQQLRDLGTRQLVVPDAALAPVPGGTDVTTIAGLLVGGATLPRSIAVVDADLAAGMQPVGDDPVLAAHHLLAELVAVAIDANAEGHGVVLVPPREWQPDATFLGTLLEGLATARLLRPLDLDAYFADVAPTTTPEGEPVARVLAPPTSPDLTAVTGPLVAKRFAIAGYTSMLDPADPLPDELEARLSASLSTEVTDAERAAYFDAVDDELEVLRTAIEPLPSQRITLAGGTSEIPLTIRSRTDTPLTVKVRFASPKLTFPEGDQIITVTGSERLRVPVEARASGTFPLTVQVLTPTGDIPVVPAAQLTVQARRLTGLGIGLTVGAALVLATWWIHHARGVRRRRRAAEAAGRHPASGKVASEETGSVASS